MTRTLTVTGMACDHCERTVEEALEGVVGVSSADADSDAETVTIEGDADVGALIEAVSDTGYDASA